MSENHPQVPQDVVRSDPFPAISQRRRRGVQVTSAAAIALGLILTGSSAAGAATSNTPTSPSASAAKSGQRPFDGARPAAVGTVKSIGDGTFTVLAHDGTTMTVDVDSSTTYFDPGVSSPNIASVTVGEQVAVFGSGTTESVTATRVAIGRPPVSGTGGPGGGAGPGSGPGNGPGNGPGGNPGHGTGKSPALGAGPPG